MSGPLRELRVVHFDGPGPGAFCAMVLADLGAMVTRISRVHAQPSALAPDTDLLSRGVRSVSIDLKRAEGTDLALQLIQGADILIEGFRPGVMERLGLGPDTCLQANPRLVYGRMTGYGQAGPLSGAPGHDINYIALAGCLAHTGGRAGGPVPPLNLLGDFGGGGLVLAVGLLAASLETRDSGRGQVVDAAIVDGAALLMTAFHADPPLGPRGANAADGGAPFYAVYECADGKYLSVGSIEPAFYAELLHAVGVDGGAAGQYDPATWQAGIDRLAAIFRTRPRQEWCDLLEGTNACVTPVLTMTEARRHPHNVARGTFVTIAGTMQPAPAPRFSRTPTSVPEPPPEPGAHTEAALRGCGIAAPQIARLRSAGVVA